MPPTNKYIYIATLNRIPLSQVSAFKKETRVVSLTIKYEQNLLLPRLNHMGEAYLQQCKMKQESIVICHSFT